MADPTAELLVKIGTDTKAFNTGLDAADKRMGGFANSIKKHHKAIGVAMTAAGAAILVGLGTSLKAAVGFESAMREVNTMIGLTQDEFKGFSKEIQNLAADLGVDAVDSANALYQAISAGVPKDNVLAFLEIATKAAIGGVTNTETAVDGLTTVINAFKLPMSDAQKIADLMFTTVKGGKTTFEELSAAMFQVAPIAAASGVRFEEVSAALATMTKQGVPTKVATTQLRQAMVALQKPTQEMQDAIQKLGFESGQAMVLELGLADTLNMLRDSTEGSNEMLMTMFGSVEAGQAVLSLTGQNADLLADGLDDMANSTGAATDAFLEMENSATRQMEALQTSFKDVMITVGNVLLPILKKLVDAIKPIIDKVKEWMENNPGLTETIVKVVGIIGGLLVVLGPLLIMLPGIISLMPIMGAAFAILTGPIGLVVVAVVAVGFAIKALRDNWDTIWGGIKRTTERVINGIIGFINTLIRAINLIPGVDIGEIGKVGTVATAGLTQRTKDIIASGAIEGFAHGGIVTSPTLAMVGENGPEAVIPLNQMGGITINFTEPVFMEREESINKLADRIYRVIKKEQRLSFGAASG